MDKILATLVDRPSTFSPDHAKSFLMAVMNGECSSAQIASFLTALKLTGTDRRPEIIAAIAQVMRDHALRISSTQDSGNPIVDIVGTGGDGQDTFNVSTAAGLVVAGAGCRVAKHGNRASSSSCGSGDVLEALGANITGLTPDKVNATLSNPEGSFSFLFSQTYHPAMKHVAPIRKELGFRTVFNM